MTFPASLPAAGPTSLPLTGERTVPGIARETYWFTRHEAVYRFAADLIAATAASAAAAESPASSAPASRSGSAGQPVVDAGCGEGYGAEFLRGTLGTDVVGLDYDETTAAHVRVAYPQVRMVRANLDSFPVPDRSCRAVVSLQVIEHLWNLAGFLDECHRVLVGAGTLVVSTPNRPVFSPGLGRQQKPTNPFHVEEFDAEQVRGMLNHAGFAEVEVLGLHHGERISEWEAEHGSIVEAQVRAALTGEWPGVLDDVLPRLTAADFTIGLADGAHDLIGIGRR